MFEEHEGFDSGGEAGARIVLNRRADGVRPSEGGTSVPHPETCLRLRQGEISRPSQEPSPTVRQLRSGQPLPAPQTPGSARVELRLEVGKFAP